MSKGLEALERLMANYYEMCQDLGNNDGQYQRCNLTSERAIIEKELKALEIFMKYVSFQEIDDDFFKYEVVDKQYVSNRSALLISEKEYALVKEVSK